MELRPLLKKKKTYDVSKSRKVRFLMGVVGFVIGVYLTVKLINIVYR